MVSSINSTNFLQVLETNSDTVNLHIKNNVNLAKISGTHDENFLLLEKLSNTKISLRGNHITIKGNNKNSETVVSVINLLLKKSFEKDDIDQEDVKSIFSFESKNLADEKFTEIAPGIKTLKKTVLPRTAKQKKYVKDLRSNNIIFALGPAGTGKTYLAVAVAVEKLIKGDVEKIILSRPAVEAGENLGFLPGDMKEKIDPYLIPLYDALHELLGFEKMQKRIEDGSIEIAPLAFMRGRTLKNSFVILDEAQNATKTQIKMFLTRLGDNSTMVVNGDPSQVDLVKSHTSGLSQSIGILKEIEEVKIVYFDSKDVQRHPLVSKINQKTKVLIENMTSTANQFFGRNEYMQPVFINANNCAIGNVIDVSIHSYKRNNLFGTII